MNKSRFARALVGLSIAGIVLSAVITLIGGINVVDAHSHCISPGTCGPEDPFVYCSNGQVYVNICAANADCQYDCRAFEVRS